MKTLTQKRADFALACVADYLMNKKEESVRKSFKSLTSGVPAMILQNGLGLTMAFIRSKDSKSDEKSDDKYKKVYEAIKDWLTTKSEITCAFFSPDPGKDVDFFRRLNQLEQNEYQVVQNEALSIVEWIKRYAAAFVGEKDA